MNHILVVDDEPDIRSTLQAILAEEGYTVTTAGTATEGLDLIRDAIFDAVLLDIWLPDRDGLEVLQDIRKFDAIAGPEVIIISGHGTIETAVRATKLGAYDFLEKPLSLERTLIILKNAVDRDACASRIASFSSSSPPAPASPEKAFPSRRCGNRFA